MLRLGIPDTGQFIPEESHKEHEETKGTKRKEKVFIFKFILCGARCMPKEFVP
jgi:hypothetical protein